MLPIPVGKIIKSKNVEYLIVLLKFLFKASLRASLPTGFPYFFIALEIDIKSLQNYGIFFFIYDEL